MALLHIAHATFTRHIVAVKCVRHFKCGASSVLRDGATSYCGVGMVHVSAVRPLTPHVSTVKLSALPAARQFWVAGSSSSPLCASHVCPCVTEGGAQ